ncbi:helix-turn-helix transcriptional regulator [Stenotrophomonas maltophilia]|uniref:helix-turn-helix transcriptional regulator n=1 Tax=Stenotrophomonas maltophilia TaxID=40324 RepID=UPI00066DC7CD|nr:WYL domain-containing protein [Stenotrophomonas maltophilia]
MKIRSNDTLMRQWEMLRMIPRAPRRISVRQILENLEPLGFRTSSRTIERDLQNLSTRFQLIADDSERPFGWSWSREANFAFTPRLSISQSVALLLSHAHLRQLLPATAMNELMPVFDMARAEVSTSGWGEWASRTAILPMGPNLLAPEVETAVQVDVHRALASRRCLSGWYRSKGKDEPKEMIMHPLGLLMRGSAQYLVCMLRDYTDIRHLALHRLSGTRVLEMEARSLPDFDFQHYATTTATAFQGQGRIVLEARFRAQAAEHLRETPLSNDQTISDLGDGWIRLRATVEDDQTLRWWLMGFGGNVRVESPSHLCDAIGAELAQAASYYARDLEETVG